MSTEFSKLIDAYLDEYYRMEPLSATFAGIHDYDDKWSDLSPAGYEQRLAFARKWRAEMDRVKDGLSGPEVTDRSIVLAGLSDYEIEFELKKSHLCEPSAGPMSVVYGLFIMFVRNYAPLSERAEMILKRLESAPAFLEGAKQTLQTPTPKFLELALDQMEGGAEFVGTILPQLFAKTKFAGDIAKAGAKAGQAIVDFGEYAKTLPPGPDFPLGKEAFDLKLQNVELLDFNTESLLAFGLEKYNMIEGEMKELASEIDPNKSYREILDEMKDEHPDADNVLDFYREWMAKTRQFVIDKELVTLPGSEILEIIETPTFERGQIPYGAYMPPAPFEKEQRGFFYVTPVDDSLTDEEKEGRLRGHNNAKVIIVALHEGYPGHHLQLCIANSHPSKLRKTSGSTVFIEGWALYCEEMMREEGFYTDKKTVLSQKQDKLWRAARVIIDASIHTGKMQFDEAVELMVDKIGLMKVNALAEVNRYTTSPTQPMSYLVGFYEIERIRERYFKQNPDASVRRFHDDLLAPGSLAPTIVEKEMFEDW